jgi:glycosyltransferase involved in cell wall biosynthesis
MLRRRGDEAIGSSMRILQVHTRYREPGGEDAVVSAEAGLLARAGHEVVPYVAENPTGALPTATSLALSAWNPRAAIALRQAVRRVRPDVAHVHNTWYALSPSVVGALAAAEVPVVATLHNYRLLCANALLFRDGRPCEDCVGTNPWPGVRHRCYRGSAAASAAAAGMIAANRALRTWNRHVRLFLALNDFARDRFVRGGLPAHKIRVKQNFVADPGPRRQPPSASGTVLYVGRLSAEKGVATVLEAWRTELAVRPLELLVVGDGPLRAELERTAPPNVRFLGRVAPSEVRHLMLSSRALLLPSVWYEGQPIAALEALASGLPVVASRLGGIPSLLELADERWLPAPGDPSSWSQALGLLGDGAEVDRTGAQLRRRYEAHFSEQVGLRLLEEAYLDARDGVARHGVW